MPLSDGIDEVVRILANYYQDGGRNLIEEYGDQAPALAEEMGNVLGAFLNQQTPFGAMYAEFQANPSSTQAELIGALEMLEESTPEITIQLQGYLVAFYELEQPGVRDMIETSEPEDTLDIEELQSIKSTDDMDNDDEYREDNTYLTGNVEDRSTSAMYYEGQDTTIEPNQTEEE